MKKTIQIGDKYKSLMEYYDNLYDKEEFNMFITKLLVCYKDLKDKNIDIIIFSELTKDYDIDIFDLLKVIDDKKNILKKQNNNNNNKIKKEKTTNDFQNSKTENKTINNPILNLGVDLSG